MALIISLFAVLGFFIFLFLFFIFLPILGGAPFVPTHRERIARALQLVNLKPGQKIADLGAGDGRILIACAKKGAEATGFEINPFLVWQANSKIKKEGVASPALPRSSGSAVCQWKNFWGQDLSSFDIVFIYGFGHIMKGLEKKLQKELKTGAKAVCFIFPFPNWQPATKENGIYLYQK